MCGVREDPDCSGLQYRRSIPDLLAIGPIYNVLAPLQVRDAGKSRDDGSHNDRPATPVIGQHFAAAARS